MVLGKYPCPYQSFSRLPWQIPPRNRKSVPDFTIFRVRAEDPVFPDIVHRLAMQDSRLKQFVSVVVDLVRA